MAEKKQDAIRATCRKILLSSPPGQFDSILADLQHILRGASGTSRSATSLTDEWIQEVRSKYSRDVTLLGASEEETTHDDSSSAAGQLQAALKSSIQKHVVDGSFDASRGVVVSTTVGVHASAESSKMTFDICVHRENVKRVDTSFYAGRWVGRYQGTWESTLKKVTLHGTIAIHAHFFEAGNVQLQTKKDLLPQNLSPRLDSADAVSECIALQVNQWEMELLDDGLRPFYRQMNDVYLKRLRRVMPMSRTKMDWNVQAHRVVKTLCEQGAASAATS